LTGFEATAYRIATDEFGTQLDPPAHWAPEYPGIDELPPTYAVCPLVVISIAKQVRKDPRYALTVADVQRFERWHGRIPKGSVVMVSCPCRAARGHGTGSDAGGYARYVAICPPGTANGTQISQRDAPLPTSDSLLHWDESLGYRVR
jgi:kynurenine formamidase